VDLVIFSSLGVRRPLTFHILIFSSETPQPNELPSFDSFGLAVSEKIFLEINQSETRMSCGGHVC
jgi:hypothetical protein